MEAGGGAFNLGVASSPQERRRKKTRRAGKKRKDARHRKVAQGRGMTDERREFEVYHICHMCVRPATASRRGRGSGRRRRRDALGSVLLHHTP